MSVNRSHRHVRGLVIAIVFAAVTAVLNGDRVVAAFERLTEVVVARLSPRAEEDRAKKRAAAEDEKARAAAEAERHRKAEEERSVAKQAAEEAERRRKAAAERRTVYRADTFKLDGLVLPLRQRPDPYAPTILDIPPTADGIEATGKQAIYDRALWLQVTFQKREGWVSAYYLKESAVISRALLPPE